MSDPNHLPPAVIDRPGLPETVNPVVRGIMAAMGSNPDPATLAKLLEVQKDWEANEARKAYAMAMVGLKRDLPKVINHDATVHFESNKGTTHYTHATLAAVVAQTTDAMTNHGFSVAWKPSTQGNSVTVRCTITHCGGHSESSEISAPIDNSGGKNSIQGIGSTISYLERYLLNAALGIATKGVGEPGDGPGGEEPVPQASRVNTALNMKAMAALAKFGKTREQVEAYLGGVGIESWTDVELAKLREWMKAANGGSNG